MVQKYSKFKIITLMRQIIFTYSKNLGFMIKWTNNKKIKFIIFILFIKIKIKNKVKTEHSFFLNEAVELKSLDSWPAVPKQSYNKA